MGEEGKKTKRLDLQGIRGIAIISVLGFHFYPSIFPNGYLGVDQFFVLSGFLMCMLLKRTESDPIFTLILNFYTKRFRRILPLYFLVIFLILVALYSVFRETAIENNLSSASNALLFVSNRPKTAEEDYFQLLGIGGDLFTHTWSLSVEIQFYFIVPIIFILGTLLFKNHLAYYTIIASLSFFFYSFSTPTVSFNSVLARIWQFVLGMMVYLYTNDRTPTSSYQKLNHIEDGKCGLLTNEDEEDNEKELVQKPKTFIVAQYVLLIFICYICSYPLAIPAVFSRITVTMSTGALMCISDGNMVLSNKMLAYIGDFSYSLYLIHWPIYTYWKLHYQNDNSALLFFLVLSIIVSIAVFELFEKWYLKQSTMFVFTMVIVLLFVDVVLLNKDDIGYALSSPHKHNKTQFDGVPDNLTLDEAAKFNYQWTANDNKNLMVPSCKYRSGKGPLGWCDHTGLNKRNKFKLMIFGNSWTSNHGKLIFDECRDQAHTIVQASAYGCEPLYPSDNSKRCAGEIETFKKNIKIEQPDYGFIITRFTTIGDIPIPKNITNVADDEMYKVMKKNMKFFTENIKNKLFILDFFPRIISGYINQIVPDLKKNVNAVEIDKKLVDPNGWETARKRYAQLFNDCGPKCVRIDYLPEFWNNSTQTFRFFDEHGLVYITGINHMSPHGLEKVRHLYTDICKHL
ncbi:unnamed protein product [Caenorhabditis bovis]|uniref:Acyl_transf_3 domain-containing protein n=1 Tax=Caenorhabditis bovis TaxID=2654633 RepID=A0A8S1FB31_9PELO|nr:unnamed protein product [Caenorhabditis bovis]